MDLSAYEVTDTSFKVNMKRILYYAKAEDAVSAISKMKASMAHIPSAAGVSDAHVLMWENCNMSWLP